MHSFHQSRGTRFLALVLALAMAASLAGAWQQTGATALVGAAAACELYGLALFFGSSAPRPAILAPADAVLGDRPGAGLEVASAEEQQLAEPAPSGEAATETAVDPAPAEHHMVEQLFDSEPFVRNQRVVFGRKTEKIAPPKTRRSRKASPA